MYTPPRVVTEVMQYYETPVSVVVYKAPCVVVKSIHNHTTGLKTNKHLSSNNIHNCGESSVLLQLQQCLDHGRYRGETLRLMMKYCMGGLMMFDDEILHTLCEQMPDTTS